MKKGNVLSLLVGGIAGGAVGMITASSTKNKVSSRNAELAEKHLAIMKVMDQWIIDKQNGKSLVSFFERNGYKSIAIYGISYLGERLIDELADSSVNVVYGIDKNATNIYSDIDIKSPEDELDDVDAVIVTPIFYFDEIEEQLEQKINCPIISIEDIVYGV